MRSSKANAAGLTSIQQQSEMKSILNGTWPPLKPLPVFRYETPEYRAKIDFDRIHGEWVCRKTSLPSNTVQELRGELLEITLALPHGEAETLIEDAEPQEQESEKDTNRRLQAIREWKATCQNGAQYSELQHYLSESQRREIDDSLRLSLTARQLQFNSKNIAYVFDALSTAGGRFATLIEFAKRNQPKPNISVPEQVEQAARESQGTDCQDGQALSNISRKCERRPDDNDPIVRDQVVADRCTNPDEPPAVSIRNVLSEQCQAPLLELHRQAIAEQFETETCESVDLDSATFDENPLQEGDTAPPFTRIARPNRVGPSSANRIGDLSPRLLVLEISAFHLAAFASLVLFAAIAFAVGLTVGRGPLGRNLRELSKSLLGFAAKSPAQPAQANETTPRVSWPVAAPSSDKTAEDALGSHFSADANSTDSNPFSTIDAKPSPESANSPNAVAAATTEPTSPATPRFMLPQGVTRHPSRASTMLVEVPVYGSQPLRVSFPEQAIAATPSLALSSQLTVVVPPERGPAEARQPVRVEAGALVSFVAPRYPRHGDGYAQVIRVRATIAPLGQVRGVKFLSGSTSLLPATMRAIRLWRYRPTLFDKKPVQAQQDITIEFLPSQYSPKGSTPHPTQKLAAVR